MAILNLKLENILGFNNFEINFSYPNKIQNSLIENEFLKFTPTFRYKKLNIFLGSNATGKTSLMSCIRYILYFLRSRDKTAISRIINKNYNFSYIEIDIAEDFEDVHKLHRFKIKTNNKELDPQILVSHSEIKLNTKSSYENSKNILDNINDNYQDYIIALNNLNMAIGWRLVLPATEDSFDIISFPQINSHNEENDYIYILSKILSTLDPSILKVTKSKDATNAVVIEHENKQKVIIQQGQSIIGLPLLSTGTKYAFNIANVIYSIKHHLNGIYLIDEQFSYVDADIEAAILSTMVSLLGDNEQLFFTTHNPNILSLRYPFHSFYFMKKEDINGKQIISCSCASEAENRNNVSPKSILDNDIFGTAPKLNDIFELGED